MPLSDIGLCARALIRIGAAPISSFDDASAESQIAGALYPSIRDALLSAYPWSFATSQIALARTTDAPIADYACNFGLPDDFLRALSAGNGGRGRGIPYRIGRGVLQADAEEITLTYIFRPEAEEFPPFFDAALIARLAAEFCIPVTENTSRAESLYRLADLEFRRARQIDAQQDSPNRIERFSLIDARE